MQTPSSNAADFDRVSSAVAWICAVAVLVSAVAWYWLITLTILLVFPLLLLATGIGLAVILSGWSLIRRGKWRPVAALTVSLTAAMLIPFSTAAMHLDFQIKRHAMLTVVSELSAADQRPHDQQVSEAFFSVPGPASGGEAFVFISDDCQAVFFPTFWGIPDGAAGFLHAPDCFDPETFPGGRFGVRVWNVRPLGQHWWRIGGN